MERRVNRAYFLIPIVYIGFIFLLLVLQFSGGKVLRANAGQLFLRGNLAVHGDAGTSGISSLNVEFQGIRFPFDSDRGIGITFSGGTSTTVYLSGYRSVDKGFDLQFDSGVSLRFLTSGTDGSNLMVTPVIPKSFGSVASVSLPFGLSGSSISKPDKTLPVFSVNYGSKEYVLTLPVRGTISQDKSRIVLGDGTGPSTIRYVVAPPTTTDLFTLWFQNQDLKVSQSDYDSAVTNFIITAYKGWSLTRYDSATGTWSGRDGTQAFSEAIVTDYLAEAWQRGDYARAYTEMRTAADKHPSDLTYLSSVFLGNLIQMDDKLAQSDQRETTRVSALVQQGNRDVFRNPHVLRFAADRGPSDLYNSLLQLAGQVDLTGVDVPTALGMLENLLDASQVSDEGVASLSRFSDLISTTIIPNVVKSDQGFFLQVRPGRIELYSSILAGEILITFGKQRGDEKLSLMGRSLVLGAIGMADDLGFMPEVLFFDGTTIKESQGSLAPETVYPLIATNPAYPREVSLYRQAGAGVWMWTILDVASMSVTQNQWKLDVRYQPNRTQYVIFHGLSDFKEIHLFGYDGPWRADPQFESYSRGRYYIPSTESLLIKYFNDTGRDSITIYF